MLQKYKNTICTNHHCKNSQEVLRILKNVQEKIIQLSLKILLKNSDDFLRILATLMCARPVALHLLLGNVIYSIEK